MKASRTLLIMALATLAAACTSTDAPNGAGGGDAGGGDAGTSAVRVIVSTQGVLQDMDGYDLSLAVTTVQVPSTWDTVLTFTDASPVTLTVAGVNPNCAVQSPNPHRLELVPGGIVTARVLVQCQGVPVRITVSTTGPDPDPDGYLIRLGGNGPAVRIPPNGEASLPAEVHGRLPVVVSGLAPNCASSTASINVVLDQPLAAAIVVTCRSLASVVGSIRVKVESNLKGTVWVWDPAGGRTEHLAQAQDEVIIPNLPAGTYRLGFNANSWGCRVNNLGYEAQLDGLQVAVVAGAVADVTMTIDCIVGGP